MEHLGTAGDTTDRKGHRGHIKLWGHKGTLPKEGTVSKIVVCFCLSQK